ncbi:MAG: multifunctional CCA addition/repair protein [Burkholderiales bacterium]|nr:multifunctional CCA addition/repair protein [Burkholderiales bacterium]
MKTTDDPVLARLPAAVRVYEVGGAVRDALLGWPVADRDYVVVGATPEAMLAAGFRPVGRDFPVFLHPRTQEEYALARAEKKSGRGYHGFTFYTDPAVTLEDDLCRRDLTINAMARAADGALIDPYGGERDLRNGVLRHVSPAFVEDPLRVLRVARFAARFDFIVADETLALMRRIADSGELSALAAERLWQETARALMAKKPSRFLQVLRACGALEKVLPEVATLYGVPQKPEHHPEIDVGIHVEQVLDFAAQRDEALPVRYALLCHDLGKGATLPSQWPSHRGHEERGAPLARALSARLKVPAECGDAAQLVTQWHGEVLRAPELSEEALLKMLMAADVLRRPQRLRWLIDAMVVDAGVRDWAQKGSPPLQGVGGDGFSVSPPAPLPQELAPEALLVGGERGAKDSVPPAARFIEGAARALQNIDAAAIARNHAPVELPAALRAARLAALADFKRAAGTRRGE